MAVARSSFVATGALPTAADNRNPRDSSDDMPGIAAVVVVPSSGATARFVVAYDDIASVSYYGDHFRAYWTTIWPTIGDAIANATQPEELHYLSAQSDAVSEKLTSALVMEGGHEYAQIGALAYRQTLAATKLTINNQTGSIGEGKMWNFLKEISTNGEELPRVVPF